MLPQQEQIRFETQLDTCPNNGRDTPLTEIGESFISLFIQKGTLVAAEWKVPSASLKGFKAPNHSVLTYRVDVEQGITHAANNFFTRRIDAFAGLSGMNVPAWNKLRALANRCYQSIPMDDLELKVRIDSDQSLQVLKVDHHFTVDQSFLH